MEVYCRETNKQVNIVIESEDPIKGFFTSQLLIAKGKPVICSAETGCLQRSGVQCFLNCEQIEGRVSLKW
jgi:hypothetical protein